MKNEKPTLLDQFAMAVLPALVSTGELIDRADHIRANVRLAYTYAEYIMDEREERYGEE